MMKPQNIPDTSRIGFHYYPDTLHYTLHDLHCWLPELARLGASWLTLMAPVDRAIPESFLRSFIEANIEPILHFHLQVNQQPDIHSLQLLFKNYAKWGVRYAVLFDRPNRRQFWESQNWGQSDLTERFLDKYLPLAEKAVQTGLTPVFPPLEPGGDYWDTAFLQAALRGISRRCTDNLKNKLVLGAYAYLEDQPVEWGIGGPERWPLARPYHTPKHQQDQRGFYIFDWYLAISQSVLGTTLPIILFGAGKRRKEGSNPDDRFIYDEEHAQQNLLLAKIISGQIVEDTEGSTLEPVPPPVLACNFWLFTSTKESPDRVNAWFQPDGLILPIVGEYQNWLSSHQSQSQDSQTPHPNQIIPTSSEPSGKAIGHYLLLPLYEWGVSEWYLDVIRPFILKHKPTVGFSAAEAAKAERVTVIGNEEIIPENVVEELRHAGCRVDRIAGDGTDIASILASN